MKNIIICLGLAVITSPSFACLNRISPEDAYVVVESGKTELASTLTYKGEDFLCFDNIDLRAADLVDNIEVNETRSRHERCEGEEDCEVKLTSLTCELGEEKIKDLEVGEIFCLKKESRVKGKRLANNPEKKARREKEAQDLELAKEKKKQDRKAAIQSAKSIADLKAILLQEE